MASDNLTSERSSPRFSQPLDWISRISLFLVYFWFGLIKITGQSPASSLVTELQKATLPFFYSTSFVIMLGVFEVAIGIAFLYKPITKYITFIALLHMATTFLPLIFLSHLSWQGFLIPTLEAQYIIKNLVLVSLILQIYCRFSCKYLPKEKQSHL